MKIDIFTHILPKRYNEKMLEMIPRAKTSTSASGPRMVSRTSTSASG